MGLYSAAPITDLILDQDPRPADRTGSKQTGLTNELNARFDLVRHNPRVNGFGQSNCRFKAGRWTWFSVTPRLLLCLLLQMREIYFRSN